MTGLLMKDWKLLKNQGKYFLTVILFAGMMLFINSWEYTSFATSYMTFLITMFALSSFSYDEYDNGMQFLLGLPISRKTYVKEKYLFGTILAVVTWTLSILMQMLFSGFQKPADYVFEFPGIFPVFLAIVFLFLGYSIPFVLKYGSEKGRTISYGTLFGVFALILILSKTDSFDTVAKLAEHVLENGMGVLILCIVSIVFFIGSYFVSVNIVEKKEY